MQFEFDILNAACLLALYIKFSVTLTIQNLLKFFISRISMKKTWFSCDFLQMAIHGLHHNWLYGPIFFQERKMKKEKFKQVLLSYSSNSCFKIAKAKANTKAFCCAMFKELRISEFVWTLNLESLSLSLHVKAKKHLAYSFTI